MSDREDDPRDDQAVDPPDNTKTKDGLSMDSTEEPAEAIDPPENTDTRS